MILPSIAGYISGDYVLVSPNNLSTSGLTLQNPLGAANLITIPCFPGTNLTQVFLLSDFLQSTWFF